jgi:hypothetical protein
MRNGLPLACAPHGPSSGAREARRRSGQHSFHNRCQTGEAVERPGASLTASKRPVRDWTMRPCQLTSRTSISL